MKILGIILALCYAGLMIFAVMKEKEKSISSVLIAVGCLACLPYILLNLVWNRDFIIILILGMLAVSAGAFMNGFRQKKIHVHHHIVRLIIEAIIVAVCWTGR